MTQDRVRGEIAASMKDLGPERFVYLDGISISATMHVALSHVTAGSDQQ